MKITVTSAPNSGMNISGSYEGDNMLPIARAFAVNYSRLTKMILESDTGREFYENGCLVKTELKSTPESKFIAKHSGIKEIIILADPEKLDEAYKQAKIKLHPDKKTGSHDLFIKLNAAYNLLTKKLKRKKLWIQEK